MEILKSKKLLSIVCLALTAAFAQFAYATDYYIAPNGSSSGTGTINSPWSISAGLQKTTVVKGGDTIWLRGGTYGTGGSLVYTATVKGSSSTAPVIIRQYPGEHAKVNAAIRANGSYVWFWGFELTNTSTDRNVVDINTERPRGLLIGTSSTGVKVINMEIHDVGRAGVGGGTNNFEIYGTLLWGNGIYDSAGLRGDATYLNLWQSTPSAGAVNALRDNIAFRNFYAGFKMYTEWSDVYVEGFDLEGNVSFDKGARGSSGGQSNFLVRSELAGKPIKRLKVINNFSYRVSDSTNPYSAEFGCKPGSGIQCEDAVIRDNYFVTGSTTLGAMKVQNWKNLQVSNNTVVGSTKLVAWYRDFSPTSVSWDGDHYYRGSSSPFSLGSSTYTFSGWQNASSVDNSGTYSASRPTGVKTIVRKNIYEPGERANIVIYNWDLNASVSVNLSAAGLADGTAYEIKDAQNFYGAPVATGVYSSSSPNVSIPMNLTQVTPLVGSVTHLTNKHTAPEFGVFVLRKKNGGTATPDSNPPMTSITSPADGASVSGTVAVAATASDDKGVSRVEFYADGAGTPFATDSASPFSGSWNTSGLSAGTHTLQAQAYDAAGNVGVSNTVSVTVSSTSPTGGTTQTLTPLADSYTRSGTYGSTNYGTSQSLYVRTTTDADFARDVFLKFDLTGISSVTSAKLRIYAATGTATTLNIGAYAVGSSSWTESGITWSNAPARGSQTGSANITGTTLGWYEIDLTNYIKSEKAAGKGTTTVQLHLPAEASTYVKMYSKEYTSYKPQLVVGN